MADEPNNEAAAKAASDDSNDDAAQWKALARKHEANWKKVTAVTGDLDESSLKELVAKARQFDALSEENKTELQKAADRAAQAEQKASSVEHQLMRYEVAAEKGIPLTEAKRLIGSTQAELQADADEYLAAHPPATGATRPPDGKPRSDLKPGNTPVSDAKSIDDPVYDSITTMLGISPE